MTTRGSFCDGDAKKSTQYVFFSYLSYLNNTRKVYAFTSVRLCVYVCECVFVCSCVSRQYICIKTLAIHTNKSLFLFTVLFILFVLFYLHRIGSFAYCFVRFVYVFFFFYTYAIAKIYRFTRSWKCHPIKALKSLD